MKLIAAIVRPFTIEKLVVAFEDIENFPGMTVTDSTGFGHRLRATIDDTVNPFRLNKRIEIACNDEMVDSIVSAIRDNAHTGKKGDGVIFVLPIEQAVII